MSNVQIPEILIPENFQKTIMDMSYDFSKTFPEYNELWRKWSSESFQSMTEIEVKVELNYLYNYVLSVYPDRVFDIISQNGKIFEIDEKVNTLFLPGIDFKLLFNCQGVSDNTKSKMWNYLKTILLSVIGENFGGMSGIFDGLNELDDFLKKEEEPSDTYKEPTEFDLSGSGLPKDLFDILSHLKGLFDGKIGSLVKSLAEEISGDLNEVFGSDVENIRSTKDVIAGLMKNPDKIVKLLKSINDRLQSKLASGEINQEDMMKELTDLISKIKGSDVDFEELFKNIPMDNVEEIIDKMGGIGGLDELLSKTGEMGGLDEKLSKMGGMSGILKILKKMGGLSGIQKMISEMGGLSGIQKMISEMGGLSGIQKMISKMGGTNDLFRKETNNDLSQIMKSVSGIFGKNEKPKPNMNNIVSDTSKMSLHEKMKNRILIKKLKEAEKQLVQQNKMEESYKNYIPYDFGEDEKKVFKIAGEEGKQETSAVSSNKKKKPKSKK